MSNIHNEYNLHILKIKQLFDDKSIADNSSDFDKILMVNKSISIHEYGFEYGFIESLTKKENIQMYTEYNEIIKGEFYDVYFVNIFMSEEYKKKVEYGELKKEHCIACIKDGIGI